MAIKAVVPRNKAGPEVMIQGILHSLEHVLRSSWFSRRYSDAMYGTQEVAEGFAQVATCNSDSVHRIMLSQNLLRMELISVLDLFFQITTRFAFVAFFAVKTTRRGTAAWYHLVRRRTAALGPK